MTAQNFQFIEQSLTSGNDFEGLVGLAQKGWLSVDNKTPILLFDHLAFYREGHTFDENVFCYWINKQRTEAELIFGGIDHTRAASEIIWIPTLGEYHWTIPFGDILVHGSNITLQFDPNGSILFDTGSSVNYMSKQDARRLHNALGFTKWTGPNVDDQYSVDCSLMPYLLDIEMTFRDKAFRFTGEDYTIVYGSSSSEVMWCDSSIIGTDNMSEGETFLMGNALMHRFFIVHDSMNERMGFADVNHDRKSFYNSIRTTTAGSSLPEKTAVRELNQQNGARASSVSLVFVILSLILV